MRTSREKQTSQQTDFLPIQPPAMRQSSLDLPGSPPPCNFDESVIALVSQNANKECEIRTPLDPDVPIDGLRLSTHDTDIANRDDDAPPRVYTPPPHLFKRFYHPSQSRRKDSAASSRRNSSSSLPSLASSHGAVHPTSGLQSKHVANHQRRDAILKDRQQRLADRAAHVEKVRLRAAIAKERTIAQSVEKAKAAQEARDSKLNLIAAACAEEVKRAKAIAESTKEKRELELLKLRQQMEERQAEAERRREELRRLSPRVRGSSLYTKKLTEGLPPVTELKELEPSILAKDTAVCRLQTWWRALSKRQALKEFAQLGLTIDGVGTTPFDKVTELLSEHRVIMTTARVLSICGLQRGKTNSVDLMRAVRCFLTAFLILGHPNQVLSNSHRLDDEELVSAIPIPRDDLTNPFVKELMTKSTDLLITFENILSRLTRHNNYTVPPTLANALASVYTAFEVAFLSWQSRDKHALVDNMLNSLVELDAMVDYARETGEPAVFEQYKESIAPNQEMLIVRIKRLIGKEKGSKAIRHAVVRARKARAEKNKQPSEIKSRLAEQFMTPESAMADLGTPNQSDNNRSDKAYPSPPSTPSSVPSNVLAAPRGKLLPDNRIVVHELAINKEYRVCADDFLEAETRALKPCLDQMRATMEGDALSREIHFYQLINVAEHIRDKLQRLVKPANPFRSMIAELLDVEQFKQRFENASFSYENFFASMGTLLPKLCAPIRDEAVKDLVEHKLTHGSYVDRLEALILFIDVMLGDYTNHFLSMVAPQLLESAAEYEAKSFANAIQQGEHGLFAAEAAWRAVRNQLVKETTRRDIEGIHHPKNRPNAGKIYTHMLVIIFTQPSGIRYGQVPEMLQLDYKRIRKYGELTRNIVTAGGMLLQCKNLLKRDIRVPWRVDAARIMTVLETAKTEDSAVSGIMAALEAGRSMPPVVKTHLLGFVQKLIAAHWELANAILPDPHVNWEPTAHDPVQPVLRLLLKRLRDHLTIRLTPGMSSEKNKTSSISGEKLASSGLAEFVDRVRDMVDEMTKVGSVDREAHAPWWETVAEKVENRGTMN